MLLFGPQLCLALYWLTRNIKIARHSRLLSKALAQAVKPHFVAASRYVDSESEDDSSTRSLVLTLPASLSIEDEIVHAIILPNYKEDIETLKQTLAVLASHDQASCQYEVSLQRRFPGNC
jgi:hypothetical protein